MLFRGCSLEEKTITLIPREKVNRIQIKRTLLFQKFLIIGNVKEYLQDKKIIEIYYGHKNWLYLFISAQI